MTLMEWDAAAYHLGLPRFAPERPEPVTDRLAAILLGVVEIAVGVYMLVYQRSPTLF